MRFTQLETPGGSFAVRCHDQPGEPAEPDGSAGSAGSAGSGSPKELVVCVHGFPDDASTFDGLARALVQDGYRVAAVNLRGYAPSPLDGSLALDDLVEDLIAVIDERSPDTAVSLIGHDYGAQLAYSAMARYPQRFRRAVLLSGAHSAFVQRNARRSLRQVWMSRYIVFFQLGRFADRRVGRDDFAYVEKLWRRWAPGFTFPLEHGAHVKKTLQASMPGPVAMYRVGGFSVPRDAIVVLTLYVTGTDDGCALPFLADGQDALSPAATPPSGGTAPDTSPTSSTPTAPPPRSSIG